MLVVSWNERLVAGFDREMAVLGKAPENLIKICLDKRHIGTFHECL